jgi:hypothetical protein
MLRVNAGDRVAVGSGRRCDNVMCEGRFAWQSTWRGTQRATQVGRTEPAASRGVRGCPSEGRWGLDTCKRLNDASPPFGRLAVCGAWAGDPPPGVFGANLSPGRAPYRWRG